MAQDQDQDILILWGICVLRVTCIDSLKTSNTTFCLNIESLAGVSIHGLTGMYL